MGKIDHEYTREVVCPYCGYEERDSWEYNDRDSTSCSSCGKEFGIVRDITVTYTTYKR